MSFDKKGNYKLLDYIKFICTFMVICVHSQRLVTNECIDFFIKNVICRIAVPFFFISSSYLIRERTSVDPQYLKSKIKGLLKNYALWSVVYIPVGLAWIQHSMTLTRWMYPLALIFGGFYTGTYYHLWYIPALIFSIVLVNKMLNHFSYKTIFSLALFFYLFGCLESYYGLLNQSMLKQIFDKFISLFFTTRNGLMYGFLFSAMGAFIFDYKEKLIKLKAKIPKLILFSTIFLILEGGFIYQIHSLSLDNNYLLSLIPFTFFFFIWIINADFNYPFSTLKIRARSQYYYFIHPICVIIVTELGKILDVSILKSGWISFFFICILTKFLAVIIINLKKRKMKLIWVSSFSLSVAAIVSTCYKGIDFQSTLSSEFLASVLISLTIVIALFMDKWSQTRKVQLFIRLITD
ncbi:acyltransferase [Enterococcus hulanensis]|uniref:acyltransferase family protein n=1 Tax=Enterococcus hulanensis TaxID=2559929 RepID=UPI001A93393E|nr:acyltransferase [Enterococcus hulanensis]MBO0410171.1 acyltransferase [Enterococcus hulanensis]